MIHAKPKQTVSALAAMVLLIAGVVACNNAADTKTVVTDSSKTVIDSTSKMSTDTIKKVDTTKMDTASTRPVKTT